MRADELDHESLLELDPAGGLIRFAGQRVLLFDAVAMGLLRKYLVENFGVDAARTLLTQFGFAQGWRMADTLRKELEWDSHEDLLRAGTRIQALEGYYQVAPGSDGPMSERGVTIVGSYEAEQHLLHFGRSDGAVCWTICGLISGYLSRSVGKEIDVLEVRCTAKGDASCQLFGRTRESWGQERANELRSFDMSRLDACLEVSLQRVRKTLAQAERQLLAHRRALRSAAPELDEPLGIVAKSPLMRKVVDLARRVAKVDSTVLITGESGSGKERIARLVHEESTCAAGPFIAVNCGAISETLLESELFGHARGAFTGASHDRPGLFEAANGGTLLLDEVGEVSPGMQVKLLRALQEREIRRVGENQHRPIHVRVIAATNRDLGQGVAVGGFRQDLYYRLKVVEIHVPALRERRDDILPLARVLLAEATLRMKRSLEGLAPAVADQLLRYAWPGNVRELGNAMERAAALAQGARVELEDLPEEIRMLPALAVDAGPVRPLADIEREYILAALQHNAGHHTRTAAQLQIGSATLYRKLKAYAALARQGREA